jgi:hypothetical protein
MARSNKSDNRIVISTFSSCYRTSAMGAAAAAAATALHPPHPHSTSAPTAAAALAILLLVMVPHMVGRKHYGMTCLERGHTGQIWAWDCCATARLAQDP